MSSRWRSYPTYQDTGIEWLGRIPAHWETRRLKYAARMNPESLHEDTDPEYPMRYVDIGNVDATGRILDLQEFRFEEAPSRARRKVRHGDTIISTVRTYLRAIAFIDDPPSDLIASTGFAVLRPNRRELEPKYLWRLVQSSGFVDAVVANSVGIGYPAIPSNRLGELSIWIPPLSEQQAIAAFLGRETAKIDALIRKQERLIELLEEKRAALISYAVTKGLDPDVPMKDSGIPWVGEIPAHWDFAALKHFLARTPDAVKTGPFGSQLLSSEMQDSEIKVYNQRNVIDRDLAEGDKYISREKFEELEAFSVLPGDILVTTRGTIGQCVTVPEHAELGILHPCLMRIESAPDGLLPDYLIFLIQDSFLVQTQLYLMSNATTIEVIYSDSLRQVIVPRPPINEQVAIIDRLNRETAKIDRLIDKAQMMIERLEEYRTALISAAVTGKIDVRGRARC